MSDYAKDLAEAERQREAFVQVIWDLISELLKAKPAPKPAKTAPAKTAPANKRKRVPAKSPTQSYSYKKLAAKPAKSSKKAAAKSDPKPEKAMVDSREGFEAEVLKLVDKLKTINVGVVLENINIARDAASAGLARLVKDGKLVRSGSRRHTSYALDDE